MTLVDNDDKVAIDSGALILVHGIPLVLEGLVKFPIELLVDKEIVELKGEKVDGLDAGASEAALLG